MGKKNKGKKNADIEPEPVFADAWAEMGGLGDLAEDWNNEDDEEEEDEDEFRGRKRGKQNNQQQRKQNSSWNDDYAHHHHHHHHQHNGHASSSNHPWGANNGWGVDVEEGQGWGNGNGNGNGNDGGYNWDQQQQQQQNWHSTNDRQQSNNANHNDGGWGETGGGDDWTQQPVQSAWDDSGQQGKGRKKKGKGKARHAQQQDQGWGNGHAQDTWGNSVDHAAMEKYHHLLTQRLSAAAPPPKGTEWRTPLPSRTLKIARTPGPDGGFTTMIPDGPGGGTGYLRFVDSGGAALEPAHRALFNPLRPSRERFHWMFPPHKERAVAECLNWIQHMSYGLANLGVLKFLETGERGALITNVMYRAKKSPLEPAFDYLTWPQANMTFDRTLQQSLAYYDPETQVVVFVFLLSESQSSMAIWRRKLTIPVTLRQQLGDAIQKKKAEIHERGMVIRIDDAVPSTILNPNKSNKLSKGPPREGHQKKKWFRWASGS